MKGIFNKYFLVLLAALISSCSSTSVYKQETIPELFDPELKKGKIFVFSNHNDIYAINVRVNGEVRKIKHTQVQIFELNDGKNEFSSFQTFLGDEVGNCSDEPYSFDTAMFSDEEAHFFVIQNVIEGPIALTSCLKDFHLKEDVFIKFLENPRSMSGEFLDRLSTDFIREFII